MLRKKKKKYPKLLIDIFAIQFTNITTLLKSDLNEYMSIRDFANIIIEKFSCLESDLSEVYNNVYYIFYFSSDCCYSIKNIQQIKNYKRF